MAAAIEDLAGGAEELAGLQVGVAGEDVDVVPAGVGEVAARRRDQLQAEKPDAEVDCGAGSEVVRAIIMLGESSGAGSDVIRAIVGY